MPQALRAVSSGTFLYEDSQQLQSSAVIWSLIEGKHRRVRGILCYLINRMSKSHCMVPFLKMTYRRLTTVSLPVKIPRICLQIPQIAREAGYIYLGHYIAQGSIISNPIFLVRSAQPPSMTLLLALKALHIFMQDNVYCICGIQQSNSQHVICDLTQHSIPLSSRIIGLSVFRLVLLWFCSLSVYWLCINKRQLRLCCALKMQLYGKICLRNHWKLDAPSLHIKK